MHHWPKRRVVVVLAALSVVGAGVAGCGGGAGSSSTNSQPSTASGGSPATAEAQKIKVLLSFPLAFVWTPVIIAQQGGYLAKEGLDATFEPTDGTSFVTQQLIAGNADYGFASSGGAIVAAAKDPDLRVVSCNEQRNIFSINVLPDSPIQTVADLKGKRLGVGDVASGEAQLVQAVSNENDLNVQVIPLGQSSPEQAVQALKSHRVDAFAGGFTPVTAIEATGVRFRDITPSKFAAMPSDCLLVKKSTLEDPAKQKIVVKLVRSLSQGAMFARANQEAAIDIGCKVVPAQCAGKQRTVFAVPYMDKVVKFETPLEGGLPEQVNVAGWKVAAKLMLDAKVVPKLPDMEQFVNSPEIQQVQKEAQSYDVAAVERAAKAYKPGS